MPDADLARRIEMLEETLTSLRELPDDVRELKRRMTGVEVQVLQLRTEMRDEFSAIRGDMATKTALTEGIASVRSEMTTKQDLADLRSELREDIAGMGRDLAQTIVGNQRELTGGLKTLTDGQSQLRMLVEDIRSSVTIRREGNPSG